MFSPWTFKKNIFGIDVNIEFDFWGSIFKTWQAIYALRLKVEWFNHENSIDFMKFALLHLPNGSFIIFYFDETKNEFIQFMKNGPRIVLDIPVWNTNVYFDKKSSLMEVLKESGIKKDAIYKLDQGENKSFIRVDFGNHNAVAAKVALKICEGVLGIKSPNLVSYESYALVVK